jgi:fimbrial chaperone protein
MRKATFSSLFLFCALLGLAGSADASSFTVNPIKVSLSAKNQSALLTLQSQTTEEIRFKILVQEWKQSPQGEMQLKDTKDIVVYPGLLTLAPNEERKLRIGSTVPPGAVERSYRVFVEELPPLRAPQTNDKSEVKVLTKMGVPIFVSPAKPTAAGTVEGMALAKGKFGFTVKNTGNVFFLVQSVHVKALNAAGASTFDKSIDGWYVLSGGTRVWEIDIPKDACTKSKSLTVEVHSPEVDFSGRMDVAAAGCAP